MDDYVFEYTLENGFSDSVTVPAVNSFMAWDSFERIAKEYGSRVAHASIVKIA